MYTTKNDWSDRTFQIPGYLPWLSTISHCVFFAVLTAWLSLRMRKGALPAGILIMLLLLVIGQLIFSRIFASRWAMFDPEDCVRTIISFRLTTTALLLIASAILAARIPRGLAICAAAD